MWLFRWSVVRSCLTPKTACIMFCDPTGRRGPSGRVIRFPPRSVLVSPFFAAVDVDIGVAESFLGSCAVSEVRRRSLIAHRRLRQFFTVRLARERGSLRFVAAE